MCVRLSTQEDYGFEITQRASLSLSPSSFPLEVTHLHAKSVKEGARAAAAERSMTALARDYPSPPREGMREERRPH